MNGQFQKACRVGIASVITASVGLAGLACGDRGSATEPTAVTAGRAAQYHGSSRGVVSGYDLAAVRAATAKYQNIDAAFADGYIDDGFGCIDATVFGLDPSEGAMGFHLINWQLHDDPANDPLRPDLLVYEPALGNGKPKLVALEYEVFRPDWWAAGNTQPPSLFGQEFESFDFDGLEIFGLHVWLWRDNPSGLFSDFNPKVACR